MRIAICDADNVFAEFLKHKIYCYFNKHKLDYVIDIFMNGEQLLKSKQNYSLIFLEYTLEGINGLETARFLRKDNICSKIIFISQNTDFVFETFCVSPFRFLKKPLNENILYRTLNDYLNESSTHYSLWINNKSSTFCINTNEIIYLEANNKYCFIHLDNKTILCKKTMAQVFEVLPKLHFQKINRAFIVNFDAINKYNSENVALKNGETLRITRTYFKNFKQTYREYSLPKII